MVNHTVLVKQEGYIVRIVCLLYSLLLFYYLVKKLVKTRLNKEIDLCS